MNETPADTLKTGARVLARGEVWTVQSVTLHADCESIHLSPIRMHPFSAARTLLRPFDRINPQPITVAPRIVTRRQWANLVLDLLASSRPYGALGTAAEARIELYPFQLEPALAMLRHGHTRVLIADQVGLGKTIQAGILINELSRRSDEFRALVLTPAGLREQWRLELAEHFSLDTVVADAVWLVSRSRDLPSEVNPWALPGIYLASLDLVKRPEVLRAIEDVTWDLFVLDEAHAASVASARLAAASAVGRRSRRVLLLTATPPDGDPPQMAALGRIGRLSDDDPLLEFRRTKAEAGASGGRRSVMLQVRLSGAERRMHRLLECYARMVWTEAGARKDARARLVSAILRKRALSSAASLAASVARRIMLLDTVPSTVTATQLLLPLDDDDQLDDEVGDAILGAAGLADGAKERALLHEIEAASRTAALRESKLRFLLRLLRRARQPAIVFTEYRDTLLHLERTLRSAGFTPLLLHGGMLPRDRANVQRAFNEAGVLLLATDAASEGLNLQTLCRFVIHFELPWTPARLEQRTGRVDRLGQRRTVHEVMLVSRDTAERVVLAPLLRRARAARNSRASPGASLAALTESQIVQTMMAGAPALSEAPAIIVAFAAANFRDEAVLESDRIAFRRRVRSRHRAGEKPFVCGSPRRDQLALRRGWCEITLIYLVSLENDVREVVQEHPLAIRTSTPAPSATTRAALRAWVAGFESRHGLDCCKVAEHAARVDIDRGLHLHRQSHASISRRERALAQHLPSTAQRLVQAGLFDGRAVRRAESLQRAATLLADESDDYTRQSQARAQLVVTVKLVAVRVDGGRIR
ncbi:MAG: DEAD/DEAH box helicase [Vicinamibacterales bacterium]